MRRSDMLLRIPLHRFGRSVWNANASVALYSQLAQSRCKFRSQILISRHKASFDRCERGLTEARRAIIQVSEDSSQKTVLKVIQELLRLAPQFPRVWFLRPR